jgi:hypothetical protein
MPLTQRTRLWRGLKVSPLGVSNEKSQTQLTDCDCVVGSAIVASYMLMTLVPLHLVPLHIHQCTFSIERAAHRTPAEPSKLRMPSEASGTFVQRDHCFACLLDQLFGLLLTGLHSTGHAVSNRSSSGSPHHLPEFSGAANVCIDARLTLLTLETRAW